MRMSNRTPQQIGFAREKTLNSGTDDVDPTHVLTMIDYVRRLYFLNTEGEPLSFAHLAC
jgi:hypothetical protein